ncbi:MAG: mechanosensitive channel MscK, partial [Alcanivorax sp.]
MDRRLPAALLILLPVLAIAQPGSFSLPGVGDLQKQLTETSEKKSDGTDNPDKEQLNQTLKFRQEIDSNQEKIKELKTFSRQAASQRTRLNGELIRLRQERQTDWKKHYASKTLDDLVKALISELDALEANQEDLADANSDLTRAQTLPEQAQNVISKAMDRLDTIRTRLNQGVDEEGEALSDLQTRALNTEMQALESRIERYNQELAIVDKQQDIARLRQQSDKQHQLIIEAKLDVLQPLINERRLNQLEETANSPETDLPQSVLEHPQVQKAMDKNRALREQLASASESVNSLLREAVNTKTELDKARSLSSTVNDQIRMLDGSLLLSRILYEQQKSLPQDQGELNLDKDISDARLSQFDIERAMQDLDDAPLPSQDQIDEPLTTALEQAFSILREERLAIYDQLDQELSRQLAILTRTQLSHEQLRKITRSLHNTISEQTFWMPSNQPLSFEWLGKLPKELMEQLKIIPWDDLWIGTGDLFSRKWVWLVGLLIPAALLVAIRRRLKRRIDEMNKDVGFLRRDSQAHTPLSLLYTFLIAAPVPLFLVLLAAGLWVQPGTFTSVMGAAVAQIALL